MEVLIVRKHFVTLCVHGNTVVTYMVRDAGTEVTFEQARNKGFNTLVLSLDGVVVSNDGFEPAEVDYFQRFLRRNCDMIAEGAAESA